MTIQNAFNRAAENYDRLRRILVPCFDEFYATVVDLVPFPRDASFRVLDLGAGTGLLGSFLLTAFPNARLILADISENMLAKARDRFAGKDQVSFLTLDYVHAALPADCDLIASALSIHHLSDEEKRLLFGKTHEALAKGGLFINADQVKGPTGEIDRRYREHWLRTIKELGIGEEELVEAFERMRYDRMADLESQLRWMREAGFQDVDCAYKNQSFVVYSGRAHGKGAPP